MGFHNLANSEFSAWKHSWVIHSELKHRTGPEWKYRWILQHGQRRMDQTGKKLNATSAELLITVLPSSKLSPWRTRENKMPNSVTEQPGYLLITEAETKCYTVIHKEHFYSGNPYGFISLWLQAVNIVPVPQHETDTEGVAHEVHLLCMFCLLYVIIACYKRPTCPLFIQTANIHLGQRLLLLCCHSQFITTGEKKTFASCFPACCISQVLGGAESSQSY